MQDLDIKIERVVLSAILFSPDKFDEICDIIKADDFSLPLHVAMFKACESLRKGDITITPELVCNEMSKSIQVTLDDIVYIASESPIADIDSYVDIIKNSSIKRRLFSLASFIRDESLKEQSKAIDVLEEIEKRVYTLSLQDSNSDFKTSQEVIESTLQKIKDNKSKVGILKGIDTGFRELNYVTTGFNVGELIIIGARPSMGKTALILSMALKIVSSGKGVAIFSLEMPAEQLMTRMLSAKSRIPLQNVRSGNMDDNEFSKLTMIAQELCEKNLYINDSSYLTLSALRTNLRKLKAKDTSISIVMIDYLQLMAGVNSANSVARHEIIAEISRGLKNLARELNIPIVALSQLNRSLESRDDKRPILSDLRESGSIEQDADVIIFLYRDEVYKVRESRQRIANQKKQNKQDSNIKIDDIYIPPQIEKAELILAKNRNGETKHIDIQYNGKFTLFEDIDEERDTSMAAHNHTKIIGNEIQTIQLGNFDLGTNQDDELPRF